MAKQLLASVNSDPFLSLSDRYDAIDVGKKTGSATKEELVERSLVDVREVRTGKRGRNPKMLELTVQGREALADRSYDVVDVGRRRIEHRYWQHRIKEYYAGEGFDVEIEFSVGKASIDVYCVQDDETVAIEVARSPEHELEYIEKCLDCDMDRVEVAYLDDEVKDQIEATLKEAFGAVPGRVAFVSVSEYVSQ